MYKVVKLNKQVVETFTSLAKAKAYAREHGEQPQCKQRPWEGGLYQSSITEPVTYSHGWFSRSCDLGIMEE